MALLRLYDTQAAAKRDFQSLAPGEVGLYVCGITVYSDCHIGHARCMLAFDILYRYLLHLGYRVRFVRNITDVDDKIIARAAEVGVACEELAAANIASMNEDFEALGLLQPSHEPKATEHISPMIELVGKLIDREFAYVGDNGDVFFSVRRDPDYGRLSKRDTEEMLVGARVESNPAKRDPLDFALWKMAAPGEVGWDSPWGRGRPGWHLECSAMATTYLGEEFDIHGGGFDLCFPHHENEWAQSRCATGAPFARLWMHSGFVRFEEEKMSKSLGNTVAIKEALASHGAEALRWLFLGSHYRSEISYSAEALAEADRSLRRFYLQFDADEPIEPVRPADDDPWLGDFEEAMNDDLNTSRALAVLHQLDKHINKVRRQDRAEADRLAGNLRFLGSVLGLFGNDPAAYLRGGDPAECRKIEELVAQRWQCRSEGQWDRADAIRAELEAEGIAVEDRPDRSIWYRLG